ncbi:MAG TPA: ADP-ribosylglycohydrolase family protein [Anaerolineales bacterium]|jgi:ADP-ribosyl-[dinitrogen reductase] hydrolase
MANKNLDLYRGCLLGLAVGDAVGTTVEFKSRGSFTPVTDMLGGGPFGLKPGQWTDDTSMALCLATSLVENNGFDAQDQMQRYLRWYREGYLSSTGSCFDIGGTILQALNRFSQTGQPMSGSTDPYSAGNGSLMRLAPVPMFYASEPALAVKYAGESSRTTHGAAECVQACELYAEMLVKALDGAEKNEILSENSLASIGSDKINAIARGEYQSKSTYQIKGSGYVVDALEAALWCFWKSTSFAEAVLAATNLGDDADTTAAICGQLAGAFYGEAGIPARWLEKLYMRSEISTLAEKLAAH